MSTTPTPRRLSLEQLSQELRSALGDSVLVVGAGRDVELHHITEDSRQVRPGSLFVARQGEKSDGRRFIDAAMAQGAVAVLCESGSGVAVQPRIEVEDIRGAWGVAAHALYDHPSSKLRVVGITGTNGKTTVASLVTEALMLLGERTARGGTLGFFIDDERQADSLTTPMPDQLAASLALAVQRDVSVAVLEVSSHALDQKRVAGVSFEVAAFTNLSQDHLDYHPTMEDYAAAKAKLFSRPELRARVFNCDDAQGQLWAERYPDALRVSASGRLDAGLRAESARFSEAGVHARVVSFAERGTDGEALEFHSPLLGKHNLENLLVAWGVLQQLGYSASDIARALAGARGVRGRLERCESKLDDITVVVDYAHTPDALSRVLATLAELNFAEISCVFGCGGDRDRKKRAPMGAAVVQAADVAIVTSDNPRTESPQQIFDDIRPGLLGHTLQRAQRVSEIPDRREAIVEAVTKARTGGCVLIAGKGHEDYQLVGGQVLHFDDCEEARAALLLRRNRTSAGAGVVQSQVDASVDLQTPRLGRKHKERSNGDANS